MKSYRAGSWYAVFGDRVTVLLAPEHKYRIPALWALVDDGAGFDAVLDELVGEGLSSLSGFGLIGEVADGVHVVLRGAVRATCATSRGTVALDGRVNTVWAEAVLDGVTSMLVEVDAPTAPEETDDLTIERGLVRVSQVREGAEQELDEPGGFVPALVVDPEPEPEPEFEEAGEAEAWEEAPAAPVEETMDERPDVRDVEPLAESPAPPVEPQPLDALSAPLDLIDEADVPVAEFPAAEVPGGDFPAVELPGGDGAPAAALAPWEDSPFAPPHDEDDRITEHVPLPALGAEADRAGSVATLLLSTGEAHEVDRPLLLGRAPQARGFQVGEEPELVVVPSANQEISSTHLEIRPGRGDLAGSAVVTDLGSTNGTVVIQPGSGPEDLQAGVEVALLPGAVVDLGDGISIQVMAPR